MTYEEAVQVAVSDPYMSMYCWLTESEPGEYPLLSVIIINVIAKRQESAALGKHVDVKRFVARLNSSMVSHMVLSDSELAWGHWKAGTADELEADLKEQLARL